MDGQQQQQQQQEQGYRGGIVSEAAENLQKELNTIMDVLEEIKIKYPKVNIYAE